MISRTLHVITQKPGFRWFFFGVMVGSKHHSSRPSCCRYEAGTRHHLSQCFASEAFIGGSPRESNSSSASRIEIFRINDKFVDDSYLIHVEIEPMVKRNDDYWGVLHGWQCLMMFQSLLKNRDASSLWFGSNILHNQATVAVLRIGVHILFGGFGGRVSLMSRFHRTMVGES